MGTTKTRSLAVGDLCMVEAEQVIPARMANMPSCVRHETRKTLRLGHFELYAVAVYHVSGRKGPN